jgi:Fe-Mn family superoxide dismutase
MKYVLSPLPYEYSSLQPWIDAQTMRIHHDYHHMRCVDGLNATQARLAVAWQSGDTSLMRYFQRVLALYESAHFLHELFWQIMGPNQGGQPAGELADQIEQDFGSFATFKAQFSAAASSLDGGGWVVLAWQGWSRQLVVRTAELDRLQPSWDSVALLVLDVSEHAYYLKYQNRRAEYVHNWWNIVNWPNVAQRFAASTTNKSFLTHNRATDRARPKGRNRYVLRLSANDCPHPDTAEYQDCRR